MSQLSSSASLVSFSESTTDGSETLTPTASTANLIPDVRASLSPALNRPCLRQSHSPPHPGVKRPQPSPAPFHPTRLHPRLRRPSLLLLPKTTRAPLPRCLHPTAGAGTRPRRQSRRRNKIRRKTRKTRRARKRTRRVATPPPPPHRAPRAASLDPGFLLVVQAVKDPRHMSPATDSCAVSSLSVWPLLTDADVLLRSNNTPSHQTYAN